MNIVKLYTGLYTFNNVYIFLAVYLLVEAKNDVWNIRGNHE